MPVQTSKGFSRASGQVGISRNLAWRASNYQGRQGPRRVPREVGGLVLKHKFECVVVPLNQNQLFDAHPSKTLGEVIIVTCAIGPCGLAAPSILESLSTVANCTPESDSGEPHPLLCFAHKLVSTRVRSGLVLRWECNYYESYRWHLWTNRCLLSRGSVESGAQGSRKFQKRPRSKLLALERSRNHRLNGAHQPRSEKR